MTMKNLHALNFIKLLWSRLRMPQSLCFLLKPYNYAKNCAFIEYYVTHNIAYCSQICTNYTYKLKRCIDES